MSIRRLTPTFLFYSKLSFFFLTPGLVAEIALDTLGDWLPWRLFSLFRECPENSQCDVNLKNLFIGMLIHSVTCTPPDALVRPAFFQWPFRVFDLKLRRVLICLSRLFIRSWRIVKDKRRHWSAIISRSRLDGGDLWPAHKSLSLFLSLFSLSLCAALTKGIKTKQKMKWNEIKLNKCCRVAAVHDETVLARYYRAHRDILLVSPFHRPRTCSQHARNFVCVLPCNSIRSTFTLFSLFVWFPLTPLTY